MKNINFIRNHILGDPFYARRGRIATTTRRRIAITRRGIPITLKHLSRLKSFYRWGGDHNIEIVAHSRDFGGSLEFVDLLVDVVRRRGRWRRSVGLRELRHQLFAPRVSSLRSSGVFRARTI